MPIKHSELSKFLSDDFMQYNVTVLKSLANCTERLMLIILSLNKTERKGFGRSNNPNHHAQIKRVVECSGYLPTKDKFYYCYDEDRNTTDIGRISPLPAAPANDDYWPIPTALLVAIVALLLIVSMITVLVKKRRRLLGATANVMEIIVWSVAYIYE